MPDRMAARAYDRTAAAQLERLLYILPAAAQEGGQDPAQLALDLGVQPVQVFRDLEEVTARVYYHPSGGADDLQISIELNCVQVRTTGEFRRPPKLSKREATRRPVRTCTCSVLRPQPPGRHAQAACPEGE